MVKISLQSARDGLAGLKVFEDSHLKPGGKDA